jgi:hypothetical protein
MFSGKSREIVRFSQKFFGEFRAGICDFFSTKDCAFIATQLLAIVVRFCGSIASRLKGVMLCAGESLFAVLCR